MSSYMCPDCGERVDEENTINDKCNWCYNGKYMYGDIQMTYSREVYDRYDEHLDECLEPVLLGTLEYSPSSVLKAVDPIAYRCDINDWLDHMSQDGYFCLECEVFTDYDDECTCNEEE